MKAISQFFNMLFTLFSAGERIAKSLDNLASVAEEQSALYADEVKAERLQAKQKLSLVNETKEQAA